MTIFAGRSWTEFLINRWRAKASLNALLRRPDDHLLDDIGITRDELRSMLGQWTDEARDRRDRGLWRLSVPAAMGRSAGVLALPAIFARSPTRRPSHGRSACSVR